MICHIVLGKEREGLSGEERQELLNAMHSLAGIEGVHNLSAGQNFSARSQGYDYGAVMYFDDRATLDAYLADSRHLAVVQVLDRLLPSRLIADYEIQGNQR